MYAAGARNRKAASEGNGVWIGRTQPPVHQDAVHQIRRYKKSANIQLPRVVSCDSLSKTGKQAILAETVRPPLNVLYLRSLQ